MPLSSRLLPGVLALGALCAFFLYSPGRARCDFVRANPSDYRAKLQALAPGDRLELEAGEYDGLTLSGLHGEEGRWIEIAGPSTGARAKLVGRSCCNTISLRDSSYVVIRDLEVDNRGLEVDGFKVESNASFAHHITLEGLHIHGFGQNQQLVGISTKAPVWDFVIRGNIIEGAGTGLYLGDSDGSDPFIRGVIENNLVVNPMGYAMQIKHQGPRPSRAGMPTDPSVTVIRHNVFIKSANASTGDLARPNLLVGHFPLSGAGAQDRYDIYGNFLYENATGTEGLFQGEGNVSFYANVLVNRFGGGAAFVPHLDVPREIAVFRNTIYVQGTGIRVSGGAAGFVQRVFQNAVFSGSTPISGGNASDNHVGALADAEGRVASPSFGLAGMDFYPLAGELEGAGVSLDGYADRSEAALDFNRDPYDPKHRGAYGGSGTNSGWGLAGTLKGVPDVVRPPADGGTPFDAGTAPPRDGGARSDGGSSPDGGEPASGCSAVDGGSMAPLALLPLLFWFGRRRRVVVVVAGLMAFACGEDGPPGDAPTYEANVRSILDARCVGCHQAGGIGPFALASYEDARAASMAALHAMETGRMPPWMPDPECRHYVGERLLGENELATFRAWVEAGTPQGTPVNASGQRAAPNDAPLAAFEATHRLRAAAPYAPDRARSDDYRCFLLDGEFETESFLTASQVVPDAQSMVHHVLVYAVDRAAARSLLPLDGADGQVGYTCFGGPIATAEAGRSRLGQTTQLGAWVPGSLPAIFDGDAATRIGAGSRIVMQVHYNTQNGGAQTDQTTFEMRLQTEAPTYLVTPRPVAVLSLDIPPNLSSVQNERSFPYSGPEPRVISAAAGHMHLLGKSLRGEVERQSGEKSCLLDIPRWDFGWQQAYRFLPGEELVLSAGDRVRLSCEYDNSAANQPVVGGTRLEPRRVSWGEGTTDEMCLMYLVHVEPYARAKPASCDGLSTCRANCEGSSTACQLGCETVDPACATCALQALVDCAGRSCATSLTAIRDCLTDCGSGAAMLGGDLEACLETSCPAGYETAKTCMDGVIATGVCDADLASCG